MEVIVLRHHGQAITQAEVQKIREIIAAHPQASRRRLSEFVCEALNWRQGNGVPRAMKCRGVMLALHRAGHIELPPVRFRPVNPLVSRIQPQPVEVDSSEIRCSLRDLGPVSIFPVKHTPQEKMLNWLMANEHYLGYVRPIGESLKFVAFAGVRPVGLFIFSSPPRHLGPRDIHIGWPPEVRRRHLHLVAYNTRFLVPSWVHVPYLASHLLSRMTRMLSQEWQKVYGHPVYFAETFVDTTRHRGTCYRAANWIFLGRTTGRGKDDLTHKPNRTIKDVLGLPLVENYRERLLRV